MMNSILKNILAGVLILGFSVNAFAEDRHIHVNGEHLEADDIQLMDQLFAQYVPNGYYWINQNTGQWGYEGNDAVEGYVPALVEQQQKQVQEQAEEGARRPEIDMSQNGRVVSGRVNGRDCTYVTVHGMSVRHCD